jgi:pyruvate formate lyase activating enzyme
MLTLVTNIQGYSIHDGPGIRTVVFFKGCGLKCRWCSNPECISPFPELAFFNTLCTRCGKCANICPNDALICETEQLPKINREKCKGCGKCSTACYYGALKIYGQSMSVDEVFKAVVGDKMFYQSSGGGVTVSGGEPLLHAEFVRALFEKCRKAGIHCAIETAGQAEEGALHEVLPYTDYVLFDLKHQNSDKHHQYTGKSNDLILSNARIAASSGVETLFRIPLIPGINDNSQNIQETADFLSGLEKKALRIEIMPYHRLGKGKYESLGRTYRLSNLLVPEPDQAERVKQSFETLGIICTISK